MKDGLPVGGYKPQSEEAIAAVNAMKVMEETILRMIDSAEADDRLDLDRRWSAIARTDIQKGFMAINRAIFKPGRIDDAQLEALVDGLPVNLLGARMALIVSGAAR